MGKEAEPLRILLFPLMAPGHLHPAVAIAKFLAKEGAISYILTTSSHLSTIQSSSHVKPLLIDFPSPLSRGDNLSAVTSADEHMDFILGTAALRPSFELIVRRHRPTAIISDFFFPWTADVAESFSIPRLMFQGTSFFSHCVYHELSCSVVRDENRVILDRLPGKIEFDEASIVTPDKLRTDFWELFVRIRKAQEKSYGIVVNSFYELEREYADYYRLGLGKRAWHIGPVFLDDTRPVIADTELLEWLDSKPESSVLYVCFGSLSRFTEAHLKEIAAGLENSGCSFIWVVRRGGERFEKTGKGLIINGWAPQFAILSHPSVGGFLTHCGWNSCLESVAAGVPVITWPMFADQFYNEKLLVEVLRVGLGVGVRKYSLREEEREVVKAEDLSVIIRLLMGDGEEAREMRGRARELSRAAREAVGEGGSSSKDLTLLIKELSERQVEDKASI